jgi:hypothetical protein
MQNDNYLLANLLVSQYGQEAWEHATRKMWEAHRAKHRETAEKWYEVLSALKNIYMQTPL